MKKRALILAMIAFIAEFYKHINKGRFTMRIAIVDDISEERTLLRNRLESQFSRRNVHIDIFEYENGELEEGLDILTLLVDSKLCTTRSDARRMVQQGGVSVNGEKVTDIKQTFGKADFDDKDRLLLKKGKKKFCQVKEK